MSYELIETFEAAGGESGFSFVSLPTGYKDLVLTVAGFGTAQSRQYITVSGDTSSTYEKVFYANSSPYLLTNDNITRIDSIKNIGTGITMRFADYTNTNKQPIWITQVGVPAYYPQIAVQQLQGIGAVTSIEFEIESNGTYAAGFKARLWGVS